MQRLLVLSLMLVVMTGCSATYKMRADVMPVEKNIFLSTNANDVDNFYRDVVYDLRKAGFAVATLMDEQQTVAESDYMVGFWYGSTDRFSHRVVVDVFPMTDGQPGVNIARSTYRSQRGDFFPTYRDDIPDLIVKAILDLWHQPVE